MTARISARWISRVLFVFPAAGSIPAVLTMGPYAVRPCRISFSLNYMRPGISGRRRLHPVPPCNSGSHYTCIRPAQPFLPILTAAASGFRALRMRHGPPCPDRSWQYSDAPGRKRGRRLTPFRSPVRLRLAIHGRRSSEAERRPRTAVRHGFESRPSLQLPMVRKHQTSYNLILSQSSIAAPRKDGAAGRPEFGYHRQSRKHRSIHTGKTVAQTVRKNSGMRVSLSIFLASGKDRKQRRDVRIFELCFKSKAQGHAASLRHLSGQVSCLQRQL